MANESRTGGRSRTATTGFTEGNGAGIDSDQAGGELARLVELTDQGHDIDRARAILAREAGDRLSPAIDETRATFGAALKGWARDTIAAYRSTRSAADLADIAHNADPRD